MSLIPLPSMTDLIRCNNGIATCDCPNAGACCDNSPEINPDLVTGELCGACGGEWLKEDSKHWSAGRLQGVLHARFDMELRAALRAIEWHMAFVGSGTPRCEKCKNWCFTASNILHRAEACLRMTKMVSSLEAPVTTWRHVRCL